jgi:hypothetical protein
MFACRWYQAEYILKRVIQVKAFFRANQKLIASGFHGKDGIIPDGGRIFGIVAESLKSIPVKPVKAIPGPKPHEPAFVNSAARYIIIG